MGFLFQVALAHDSGLPEDVSVNTFHTGAASMTPTDFTDWCGMLEDLYTAVYVGNNIFGFLSNNLSGDVTIKSYDLSAPEPRAPEGVFTDTWTGLGISALPSEVAVCLSYQGDQISGAPQARRRGRIYLGPLAYAAAESNTIAKPADDLIATVCAAADAFRAATAGAGQPWAVYSRVDDAFVNVTNGWVDNAFDTQRRRGEAATARTLWS